MPSLTKRRLNRFGRKHRRAVAALRERIRSMETENASLRAFVGRADKRVAELSFAHHRLTRMTLWDWFMAHVFRKDVSDVVETGPISASNHGA
jgi:hypothetical protein